MPLFRWCCALVVCQQKQAPTKVPPWTLQAVYQHAHDSSASLLRYSYRRAGGSSSGGGEEQQEEQQQEQAASPPGASTLRSPLVWGTTAYRSLWERAREIGEWQL